jgi:hypothetical protein
MFDKILMGAAGAPGGISYDYFFLTGKFGFFYQTFDVNSLANLDVISAQSGGILLNTNDTGVQSNPRFTSNTYACLFNDSFVDSSDNIHVIGRIDEPPSSVDYPVLYIKFDNSGSILLNKTYTTSTSGHINFGRYLKLDSFGNIYLTCYTSRSGASYTSSLIKINPSGTILWQKTFTDNLSSNVFVRGLAVDSNDDVIISLRCGSPYGAEIIKFNSSGTLQWSYHYSNSSSYAFFPASGGLDTDSNDNIYFGGYGGLANGMRRNTVVKLNSSGTIQWHSTNYSYSGSSQFIYGLHVSSDDKLYFCGNYYNYNTFDSHAHWTELNTSTGAVNLARWCIFPNTNNHFFWDIKTDVDGNVVCGGYRNMPTGSEINIARFPSDGSLTGTYNAHSDNLTYAAVSPLTTNYTALLSSGSAITTISTGTYTDSSTSFSTLYDTPNVTTTILT